MTKTELKQLIKLMRTQGVLELKMNGTEIILSPASIFPDAKEKPKSKLEEIQSKAEEEKVAGPPWMTYTPEQLATWSAPDPESDSVGDA